jgi:hypothetical protein
MKKASRTRPLIALCLAVAMHVSVAGEPRRLSGTYQLSGESANRMSEAVERDTHVRFYLNGRSAADLYRVLAAKPKRDECFNDGSLTKAAGDFICTKHPKGAHECWFGLDLRTQRVVPGFVC